MEYVMNNHSILMLICCNKKSLCCQNHTHKNNVHCYMRYFSILINIHWAVIKQKFQNTECIWFSNIDNDSSFPILQSCSTSTNNVISLFLNVRLLFLMVGIFIFVWIDFLNISVHGKFLLYVWIWAKNSLITKFVVASRNHPT